MMNNPRAVEFVGDVDLQSVVFKQLVVVDKRMSVDVCREDKTGTRRPFMFNLCAEALDASILAPYGLDKQQENSDGSRRSLLVKLEDDRVIKVLSDLDELVVATAVSNSKEWFKKAMTVEEVRARYKPLVFKKSDEDENYSMRFKVKCTKYPTRLHLLLENGDIVKEGASIDNINRGSRVVPILSVYGVWFMPKEFGLGIQAEEIIVTPGSVQPELSMFQFKRPVTILSNNDINNSDATTQAFKMQKYEDEEA